MKHYSMQLTGLDGAAIAAAGGVAYVAVSGGARKVALKKNDGSVQANPVPLVNGKLEFNTDDAVAKVDLFIQTPFGSGLIKKNVFPSGEVSLPISVSGVQSTLVIPFSIFDTAANTETQTGFVHPTRGSVLPSPAIEVTAIDAGIVIDVGTLSTDSGDADGYIDGVSVATLGRAKPTLATAGITLGVLLWTQDSANAGDEAPEQNVSMSGKGITYTLSAGADTAEGFIVLPTMVSAAGLA